MNSIKKYPIIILSILILSNFLPKTYMDIFSKRTSEVNIEYSPVLEKFIKKTNKAGAKRETIYSSIDDKKIYTQEKFQELLPFTYYFNLIKWGTFPDKFEGFKNNTHLIMKSKQFLAIFKSSVDSKRIPLYPLFETQSKFIGLKVPNDVFRFKEQMEFIDVATNKINKEKTKIFTKALVDKGFTFPALKIFGNPTTMKSFDAGYFVKDKNKKLFQIKMQKSLPFVKEIPTKGIDFKAIGIRENKRKEFYGLALSEDNKVYLFMHDDYEFIELPIKHFDYKNESLVFSTDPLYRYIKISKKDEKTNTKTLRFYVTNLDYELVDENIFTYKYSKREIYEFMKKTLFSFSLEIKKAGEYSYYPVLNKFNIYAFIFNIILVIGFLIYIIKTKRKISEHLINLSLVLFAGIYTLISIFAFDRLFYFRKKL